MCLFSELWRPVRRWWRERKLDNLTDRCNEGLARARRDRSLHEYRKQRYINAASYWLRVKFRGDVKAMQADDEARDLIDGLNIQVQLEQRAIRRSLKQSDSLRTLRTKNEKQRESPENLIELESLTAELDSIVSDTPETQDKETTEQRAISIKEKVRDIDEKQADLDESLDSVHAAFARGNRDILAPPQQLMTDEGTVVVVPNNLWSQLGPSTATEKDSLGSQVA